MTYQINPTKMKEFADALGREMESATAGSPDVVAHARPGGGFHLTSTAHRGDLMRARFNGLTVAVTHERLGMERLLRLSFEIEAGQVVARFEPPTSPEPLTSRQLAIELLTRFLQGSMDPAERWRAAT